MLHRKLYTFLLGYFISQCALLAKPDSGFEKRPFDARFAACAKRNFPPKAKPYVTEALVTVEVFVDENGIVLEVEPMEVKLVSAEKSNRAQRTKPMFARASVEAFLGQKCPIVSENGKAIKYRTVIPVSYELGN